MIFLILIITGLAFGSFVNALVWRIEKQSSKRPITKINDIPIDLSIVKGRSVCVHCGHELAAKDLVPVLSWVTLGGRCRYCRKKIPDSPIIEIATMALFLASYLFWPVEVISTADWVYFGGWLLVVVGLAALFVYDIKHLILPNRIIFPLMWIAIIRAILVIGLGDSEFIDAYRDIVFGLLVGGGFFYALFQISGGRWIGGGDVKLGFLIGLVAGPTNALIAVLSSFYIATGVIVPLMLIGKVSRKSRVPFGPFLIIGLILSVLYGAEIDELYRTTFGL